MVNVKFAQLLLEKNQNISLLIIDLVKKLVKEISSSRYCSKNHPKIPKVLQRLEKKFGNFWINIR